MRGQIILLTAVMIALAVVAVLALQAVSSASPGYGGVRGSYGVFSQDLSKAVAMLASYVNYMGSLSLINFTESSVRYAFPAAASTQYARWLHINATRHIMNASVAFFELNRGSLGLSIKKPLDSPAYRDGEISWGTGDEFFMGLRLRPVPNGTFFTRPYPQYIVSATYYDVNGAAAIVDYALILSRNSTLAQYAVRLKLNVSLLAIADLKLRSTYSVTARLLRSEGECSGAVCVNITTSVPYGWNAVLLLYNRSIVSQHGEAVLKYDELPIDASLHNHTENSAVYMFRVDPAKLYEPYIKVAVGNVVVYLTFHGSHIIQHSTTGSAIVNNGRGPVVVYNKTRADVFLGVGRRVSRIDARIGNERITYWVIHPRGYLNLTMSVDKVDTPPRCETMRPYICLLWPRP